MGSAVQYVVDRFLECSTSAGPLAVVQQIALRDACKDLSAEEFQNALALAYKMGNLTLLSIEGGKRFIAKGAKLGKAGKKVA